MPLPRDLWPGRGSWQIGPPPEEQRAERRRASRRARKNVAPPSATRPRRGDQLASTSGDANPERALLAREDLQSVLAAMPALTEKERTALAGDLNDKSHQQIANEQGSTRKAVSTALRRARDKLALPESRAA